MPLRILVLTCSNISMQSMSHDWPPVHTSSAIPLLIYYGLFTKSDQLTNLQSLGAPGGNPHSHRVNMQSPPKQQRSGTNSGLWHCKTAALPYVGCMNSRQDPLITWSIQTLTNKSSVSLNKQMVSILSSLICSKPFITHEQNDIFSFIYSFEPTSHLIHPL